MKAKRSIFYFEQIFEQESVSVFFPQSKYAIKHWSFILVYSHFLFASQFKQYKWNWCCIECGNALKRIWDNVNGKTLQQLISLWCANDMKAHWFVLMNFWFNRINERMKRELKLSAFIWISFDFQQSSRFFYLSVLPMSMVFAWICKSERTKLTIWEWILMKCSFDMHKHAEKETRNGPEKRKK